MGTVNPGPPLALVTGAAGGIGQAIVARLAEDGFAVAAVDRLHDWASDPGLSSPGVRRFGCDVSSAGEVSSLHTAVNHELGQPDVVVNAAGVFFTHRIPDLSEADWDRTIDVNLKGPFLVCRAFLPDMVARGSGNIVNIASTAGLRGGRDRAAYCASKAGLVMFTRSLALDHGRDGIRVNCVCPGLIETAMADWITSRPDALEAWRNQVPAGRIGQPKDIADMVGFLASPAADYVQGAVLLVDGGVSA